jgi:hypothetical protein|tara:strand:- start:6440 stop:6646 length:207 start_codon:yes stop_codon:yes gene_type:complete
VAELLNLRFQFEQITENYTMPRHGSDIDILEWYIDEGYKSNSLRNGYNDALNIAKQIVGELNGPSKEA